ncbi:MAG: hypothetical protein K6T76_00205 [Alicyclobacillus mali]|uniref:hypothetical protein n=1 Tax=Alicyclobacillus mali (ex Roth et al. 2021) TaxID=1123961 RepID=UPI0023F17BE2|nr:hypothetical protein [Alicyclobacillus mali (ex Roth et al. 2021)]MCL6487349.1 hypothetical protein [Alicyclobacillus mali (ex Roth et al. 2021)]
MRLGLNIEYEGKNYDILELPSDAFVQMIPGLTEDQYYRLLEAFEAYCPDDTLCRHHILDFIAEQVGASIDYILLNREQIYFDETDVAAYIDRELNHGKHVH